MRVILLVAAMTCFLVAMILAGSWGWFGIDENPRLIHVWGYAGALWFAASWLPWHKPLRRWFNDDHL
jgi:hypothetical protein